MLDNLPDLNKICVTLASAALDAASKEEYEDLDIREFVTPAYVPHAAVREEERGNPGIEIAEREAVELTSGYLLVYWS